MEKVQWNLIDKTRLKYSKKWQMIHPPPMAIGIVELVYECFPNTRAWEQQEWNKIKKQKQQEWNKIKKQKKVIREAWVWKEVKRARKKKEVPTA